MIGKAVKEPDPLSSFNFEDRLKQSESEGRTRHQDMPRVLVGGGATTTSGGRTPLAWTNHHK